jgi:hypothetical protein
LCTSKAIYYILLRLLSAASAAGIFQIGDAVEPRAIHEAIEEANQVARMI